MGAPKGYALQWLEVHTKHNAAVHSTNVSMVHTTRLWRANAYSTKYPGQLGVWKSPWVWVRSGYGNPHGYGYGVGMGIEIPSPRQPWKYPTTIYHYLTIMQNWWSTYDGRLIYRTSYEERKAFLRQDFFCKIVGDSVWISTYDIPKRNLSTF